MKDDDDDEIDILMLNTVLTCPTCLYPHRRTRIVSLLLDKLVVMVVVVVAAAAASPAQSLLC